MTQTPTNRQTQIGLFFQDTYHATPKLVLDLGIRYDYLEAVKPKGKGGASNYDTTDNSLNVAGYGSGPLDLANGVGSQNLVQPRVGFAYSIDNKSVIRGGFAMSGWAGRFGFTGGTLSTQFPVIYNIQDGNTGGYGVTGSILVCRPLTLLPSLQTALLRMRPIRRFLSWHTETQFPTLKLIT